MKIDCDSIGHNGHMLRALLALGVPDKGERTVSLKYKILKISGLKIYSNVYMCIYHILNI